MKTKPAKQIIANAIVTALENAWATTSVATEAGVSVPLIIAEYSVGRVIIEIKKLGKEN
jgi:hypothetical protein